MAQAFAGAREAAGAGETDAFAASEAPLDRRYDAIIALSRSGTTTEVADALASAPATTPTFAVVGVNGTPVAEASVHRLVLDFADEESVVQTRFATTALVYLLARSGLAITPAPAEAAQALAAPLPVEPGTLDAFTFLGRGWTVGLANEAALKLREAALASTDSYPGLEYRHGPIALAGPRTVVWQLGAPDHDLLDDVRATGATVVALDNHPLADLVLVQRLAVALAQARGLDPDNPRNLTRSVVLR